MAGFSQDMAKTICLSHNGIGLKIDPLTWRDLCISWDTQKIISSTLCSPQAQNWLKDFEGGSNMIKSYSFQIPLTYNVK